MKPFIPSWLDDYGLSKTAFRVSCHLWRRAGRDGECYPSAKTIAKVCRITRDSVWPALKELETHGLLRREHGKGRSNHYQLVVPENVGGKDGPTPSSQQAETRGLGQKEKKGRQETESAGQQQAEKDGHKGYPSEVPHISESKGRGNKDRSPSLIQFPFKSFSETPPEVQAKFRRQFTDRDTSKVWDGSGFGPPRIPKEDSWYEERFQEVRQRKLTFRDKHTLDDWKSVIEGELEKQCGEFIKKNGNYVHRVNAGGSPRDFDSVNDYSGITDK